MQLQQLAPQQQLHQYQEVAHPVKERLSENPSQDIPAVAAKSLNECPIDIREERDSTRAATQSEARPQAPEQLEVRLPVSSNNEKKKGTQKKWKTQQQGEWQHYVVVEEASESLPSGEGSNTRFVAETASGSPPFGEDGNSALIIEETLKQEQLEARPTAADQQKFSPRAATQQEARSLAAANQQTERPRDVNSSSKFVHTHKRKTRRGCRGGKNNRRICNTKESGRTRAANHQKARPTVEHRKEARPRAAPRHNMQQVRQVEE